MVYSVLKEASLAKRRGVDLSGVNCSIVPEDMITFNVSVASRAIFGFSSVRLVASPFCLS